MTALRPIDTAPQDGSRIWAYVPELGRRVVYWSHYSGWLLKDADRPVQPTVWYGLAGLSDDTPPARVDSRAFRPAGFR